MLVQQDGNDTKEKVVIVHMPAVAIESLQGEQFHIAPDVLQWIWNWGKPLFSGRGWMAEKLWGFLSYAKYLGNAGVVLDYLNQETDLEGGMQTQAHTPLDAASNA